VLVDRTSAVDDQRMVWGVFPRGAVANEEAGVQFFDGLEGLPARNGGRRRHWRTCGRGLYDGARLGNDGEMSTQPPPQKQVSVIHDQVAPKLTIRNAWSFVVFGEVAEWLKAAVC
jgi:hypothetical protein